MCRKSGNPAFKGPETLDMALDSLRRKHTNNILWLLKVSTSLQHKQTMQGTTTKCYKIRDNQDLYGRRKSGGLKNQPTTNETRRHQSRPNAPLIIINRRRLYHKVKANNLNPHYLVIRPFCSSSGTSNNHKRIAFLLIAILEQ